MSSFFNRDITVCATGNTKNYDTLFRVYSMLLDLVLSPASAIIGPQIGHCPEGAVCAGHDTFGASGLIFTNGTGAAVTYSKFRTEAFSDVT